MTDGMFDAREAQDKEITLGTGKLLGLFFGLVILCAVFFGLGFSLGRNSAKTTELTMQETPATSMKNVTPGSKIDAGSPERAPQTIDANAGSAGATPVSDNTSANASAANNSNASTGATPEMSNVAQPPSTAAYVVQVAAVSKQEDAEALVDALKRKSYPVFLASNGNTDKLFHVQVGPFGDLKDAEAMKTRLVSDGYNPIVKR